MVEAIVREKKNELSRRTCREIRWSFYSLMLQEDICASRLLCWRNIVSASVINAVVGCLLMYRGVWLVKSSGRWNARQLLKLKIFDIWPLPRIFLQRCLHRTSLSAFHERFQTSVELRAPWWCYRSPIKASSFLFDEVYPTCLIPIWENADGWQWTSIERTSTLWLETFTLSEGCWSGVTT